MGIIKRVLKKLCLISDEDKEREYYHNFCRARNMQFDGTDIDQEITDEWLKEHPNYLKLN